MPQEDPKCIVEHYISNITWHNFKQVFSRIIHREQHQIQGVKQGGRPGPKPLSHVLLALQCPAQSHLQLPFLVQVLHFSSRLGQRGHTPQLLTLEEDHFTRKKVDRAAGNRLHNSSIISSNTPLKYKVGIFESNICRVSRCTDIAHTFKLCVQTTCSILVVQMISCNYMVP